jgi:hypothetical protein
MRISALYIRQPHASMVISGEKRIETRGYEVPRHCVDRPIAVLVPGVKGPAQVVGWARITGSKMYMSHKEWVSDYPMHRIPDGDERYGYDMHQVKYAWYIQPEYMLWPRGGKWIVEKGGRVWTHVRDADEGVWLN